MNRPRTRAKQALLATVCLTTGIFGSGCQQIQALIQMVMSQLGGGGGIFNPPGSGGGGGILPPGLTGGGGPLSPTSTLPPPAASQQTIQQIMAQYGVPITGSAATPQVLERVVFSMQRFKKEHFQGLQSINIPQSGGGSISGLWQGWGNSAKITLYARMGNRVPVSRHTTTHEIGHHVSLHSRERILGDPLSNALGTSVNAFPTGYSYTNDAEKLAENIAFILLGKDCESTPRQTWRPTVAAIKIMETEFGRSWGTTGQTGTTPPATTPPATGTGTGTGGVLPTGSGGPTATTPTRPSLSS